MEFLKWVFDEHYILSMLFMPGTSIFWHYYYGHTWMVVAGLFYVFGATCLKASPAKKNV